MDQSRRLRKRGAEKKSRMEKGVACCLVVLDYDTYTRQTGKAALL